MFPVLILDDDALVGGYLEAQLNQLGYLGILAVMPADPDHARRLALAKCREYQPAAVFVDAFLGEQMSGIDVMLAVKSEFPGVRLILITGEPDSPSLQARLSEVGEVPLLAKQELKPNRLLEVLKGCGAQQEDLPTRVHAYLGSLKAACDLWLSQREASRVALVDKTRYWMDGLSSDHRKPLAQAVSTLQGTWPPSSAELGQLRQEVSQVASLLDPEDNREAIHFLTHALSNNYLLGWELLQRFLNDRPALSRFREALHGQPLTKPLLDLVDECLRCLPDISSSAQLEILHGLLCRGLASIHAPVLPPPQLHLRDWGRITSVCIVEDDPRLGPMLELWVRQMSPGIDVYRHSDRLSALDWIETVEKRRETLLLLDLSLPFSPGDDEKPDYGLSVLSKASQLHMPTVVLSGVTEIHNVVRRCLSLGPLDYLLKQEAQELRLHFRRLFTRRPPGELAAADAIRLFHWTRCQILYGGVAVELRPVQFRLLELLAEGRRGVPGLYATLYEEGYLRSRSSHQAGELLPARKLEKIAGHLKSLHEALEAALRPYRVESGRVAEILEVPGKRGADRFASAQITLLIPIEVHKHWLEDQRTEAQQTRSVLIVDADRDFASSIERYLAATSCQLTIDMASSFDKARSLCRAHMPDIVIVEPARPLGGGRDEFDLREGLGFLQELASHPQRPELIVCTAATKPWVRVQITRAFGMDLQYVNKGSSSVAMAEVCRAFLTARVHWGDTPIAGDPGRPHLVFWPEAQADPVVDGVLIPLGGDGDCRAALRLLVDLSLQLVRFGDLLAAAEGVRRAPVDPEIDCIDDAAEGPKIQALLKRIRSKIRSAFAYHGRVVQGHEILRDRSKTVWLNAVRVTRPPAEPDW